LKEQPREGEGRSKCFQKQMLGIYMEEKKGQRGKRAITRRDNRHTKENGRQRGMNRCCLGWTGKVKDEPKGGNKALEKQKGLREAHLKNKDIG